MDLLFSKYASPYLLLDQVIEEKRLCEFLNVFAEAKREKDLETIWINKVHDKTYKEFKDTIVKPKKPKKEIIKANIDKSHKMLNGFIPS